MELPEQVRRWDGKDTAPLVAAHERLATDDGFLPALLEGMRGEESLQRSTSWLLERSLEQGARLRSSETTHFAAGLAGLEGWEAQLHALQCLPYLDLPSRSRAALERFVRDALGSRRAFVQAWAYNGLAVLARRFEDLRPEVRELLAEGHRRGSAAVRTRIRHIRKDGF